MPRNLTRQLIEAHLVSGEMTPGQEIGLRIDQTLTQDATGTLVMLELEAMGVDRVQTELSAQYVDHNLIQEDYKNPDDHLFLESACRRFGIWYSRPGNGVSHPVHQQRFGRPGKTLLGSDSHTPAGGALGMLAFGAGGMEVALAMTGQPYYLQMPKVWNIELTGKLPEWVSAKDVILELLRRYDVDGGRGYVLEYSGSGLDDLSAMDRHVIANMGTELGATTSIFPADQEVRRYLNSQQRGDEFEEFLPDEGCDYDRQTTIELDQLEPLIAMPSSPGNVQPVREVDGQEIYQSYIGSSANPGYRDFAVAAEIVKGKTTHHQVSFDVNPTSRQLLLGLIQDSHLSSLISAGARLHQAGCNGCIGMGQSPASGKYSLRTVPRNFPGRSGTEDDLVCLVSPETAAASALTGQITDPRELGAPAPVIEEPESPVIPEDLLSAPPGPEVSREVELVKGPNVVSLPEFENIPDELTLPVLLKVADDISTDEIMPAGAEVLPYRSNIPRIADFVFRDVSPDYPQRARETASAGGHVIIAGENYGQGSSREHAALAPRYLGLRMVAAKYFARIHWQNLVNFGVLPLTFVNPDDYEQIQEGDLVKIVGLSELTPDSTCELLVPGRNLSIPLEHTLSQRQIDVILAGGLINWIRTVAPG